MFDFNEDEARDSYSQLSRLVKAKMINLVEGLDYERRMLMMQDLVDKVKNYEGDMQHAGYHQLFIACAVLSAICHKEQTGSSDLTDEFINDDFDGDE